MLQNYTFMITKVHNTTAVYLQVKRNNTNDNQQWFDILKAGRDNVLSGFDKGHLVMEETSLKVCNSGGWV